MLFSRSDLQENTGGKIPPAPKTIKQNGVEGLGQGIFARLVPPTTNTFKVDEAVVRVGC